MLNSDFWRRYFRTYDVLNIVIPYQNLMKSLIDALEVKKGDLILDAGAGTGNLAIKLQNLDARVIAIDSSKEGLDLLNMKNKEIKTVVHDLSNPLKFDDNFFDKIVSNNVIYAISPEKRDKIFLEFFRILKPGGRIVISNVKEGWKPINIYKAHLKIDKENIGFMRLILKIFKLIMPTVKMFYYNSKIKKENKDGAYSFMGDKDQINLLSQTGFINISKNLSVYANQAIMNLAIKPL